MGKVVVVGSCNVDLVIKLPRLPRRGETVSGGEFSIHYGGKGANQAAAAKLAGAEVEFVGKVGAAAFGGRPVEGLRGLGVGLSGVVEDPTVASGVAFILVDDQGQNIIGVAPGANARLSPADLAGLERLLAGARVVMVQLEIPLESVEYVLTTGKRLGLTTLLDPAPVRSISDAIYHLVDVITPNEMEATALTGSDASTIAGAEWAGKKFLDRGVKAAVITIGAKGAVVVTPEGTRHVIGIEVEAVDATAAGDAFNGTLAAALADGKDLMEAVALANCAGALAVTKVGAQSALPSKEEIEQLCSRLSRM